MTSGRELYRAAWVLYLALAIIGSCWIAWRDRGLRLEHVLHPETLWIDLGVGIAAGALLLALWAGVRRLVAGMEEIEAHFRDLLGTLSAPDRLSLAVISGISEEVFFRGAIQSSWGWPAATVLFALAHLGPNRRFYLWTLFALLAGLVFAALCAWRGALLAPIMAHAVVNGVSLMRLERTPGETPPPITRLS